MTVSESSSGPCGRVVKNCCQAALRASDAGSPADAMTRGAAFAADGAMTVANERRRHRPPRPGAHPVVAFQLTPPVSQDAVVAPAASASVTATRSVPRAERRPRRPAKE